MIIRSCMHIYDACASKHACGTYTCIQVMKRYAFSDACTYMCVMYVHLCDAIAWINVTYVHARCDACTYIYIMHVHVYMLCNCMWMMCVRACTNVGSPMPCIYLCEYMCWMCMHLMNVYAYDACAYTLMMRVNASCQTEQGIYPSDATSGFSSAWDYCTCVPMQLGHLVTKLSKDLLAARAKLIEVFRAHKVTL